MESTVFDGVTSAELCDSMEQIVGVHNASLAALFPMIAEYDERGLWREDGAVSMEAWVSWRFALTYRTACDWVTKANALARLPQTAAAFAEGRVSTDQLSCLVTLAARSADATTRDVIRASAGMFGHPDSDEPDPGADQSVLSCDADLVRVAQRCTARQLQRLVQLTRPRPTKGANDDFKGRRLDVYWDSERRILHLSNGELCDDLGAQVYAALKARADNAPKDPETGEWLPRQTRYADALVDLVAAASEHKGHGHRAEVFVHVDGDVLAGAEGTAHVTNGPVLSAETVRRLACFCRVNVIADGPDGQPIGVGRSQRIAPAWLYNMVVERDGGCRWPACPRTEWLEVHHIREWKADLGPTDRKWLMADCSFHHHLSHEGGWRVEGDADGELRFISPAGKVLTSWPASIRKDVQEWLFRPDGPMPRIVQHEPTPDGPHDKS